MGIIKKQIPVKLIVGFIFQDGRPLNEAKKYLVAKFGPIDHATGIFPFTLTDYYEKEFGKDLKRNFISFHKLILPDKLPEIKILTNRIEENLAGGQKRSINIDPGYVDMSKLVLATTKDYSHRIYLAKGIFAEITLRYQEKQFKPWEWTYPDYKTKDYLDFFNKARNIYANQIRK